MKRWLRKNPDFVCDYCGMDCGNYSFSHIDDGVDYEVCYVCYIEVPTDPDVSVSRLVGATQIVTGRG